MMTHTPTSATPVALVTGGSRGLGRALAHGLAARGWHVIVDARDADALRDATAGHATLRAVPGDVTAAVHRADLAAAVAAAGRLDLLVNNASALGPSPLPALDDVDDATLADVYRTNVIAPLLLFQAVRPALDATGGMVINITSDAASGPWPGWGVYGSSKAALDQLTNVLAAEHPTLAVYALDPGDLRTAMHQAAFPGEDISDRPDPATVVPTILQLVSDRPSSGRYRVADLVAPSAEASGVAS
jgi:NAD(P)-dependent dehydrogenase (short-subunit alcohol dehydrogenase family)